MSNKFVRQIIKSYGFTARKPKGKPMRVGIHKNDEPLFFVGDNGIIINGPYRHGPIPINEIGVRRACTLATRELKRRSEEIQEISVQYKKAAAVAQGAVSRHKYRNGRKRC